MKLRSVHDCKLGLITSGSFRNAGRVQRLQNIRNNHVVENGYRRSMSKVFASYLPTNAALAQDFATLSSAEEILNFLERTPLPELMNTAAGLRDQGFPSVVTFSPTVFIPLTQACRDSCGYCTFAQGPVPGRRVYMTIEEVLAVCRMGAEQGCTEALFTLGKLLASFVRNHRHCHFKGIDLFNKYRQSNRYMSPSVLY